MTDDREKSIKYHQKRRITKVKLQRKVRNSQKRINNLRKLYKLFLVMFMLLMCIVILKLPQWRLKSDAFDNPDNPVLEIVNNKIVSEQKILSALRRNQVSLRPIFLVKTMNLQESIKQLEPIQDVYIRRFWNPARLQIIVIERTPVVTIAPDIDIPPIAFFSSDGKLIGREYMPLDKSWDTVSVITYGHGDDYRNFCKLA